MQQSGQEFETAPYQQQRQQEQLAELHLKLESEQQKSEEYLDLLRRTQADFINYKRRTGQEQQEGRIAGQAGVLEQLLPVLDDLGLALSSAPPELANMPWVQGLMLVARRLTSTLEQMGVRQIGRAGEPFDPRLHEAVSIQANTGVPDGTIVQVTRPGYALGERIIRPAQVIVAGHA
jgi:molecular chaperone GrpE